MDGRGTGLEALVRRYGRVAEVDRVRTAIRAGGEIAAAGQWGASGALLLATLAPAFRHPPTLVVTEDENVAQDLEGDLRIFTGDLEGVRAFPAFDHFEGNGAAHDFPTLAGRLTILQQLLDGEAPRFLVSPVAGLLQPVPAPGRLRDARRRIRVGDRLDLEAFARELADVRFSRVPMVEAPGEFSVRGGILDVFPLSREAPYRVELFDDEVDSIRQFEPATQRSVAKVETFRLTLAAPGDLSRPKGGASLLDYLPEGHLLVINEERAVREWVSRIDSRLAAPGLVRRLTKLLAAKRAGARLELTSGPVPAGEDGVKFPVHSVTGTAKSVEELEEILDEVTSRNAVTLLFANNPAERTRVDGLLAEAEETRVRDVEVEVGRLSRSFQLPEQGFAFISHDEVFDRYRLRRPPKRRPSAPIEDFVDLKRGDHVVHLGHGIGIYRGLKRIVKGGETEEFLKVEFADSVTVYVPVTKANLVQRYVGTKEFRPRLSKVGASAWERKKERVKEAVKDLAADLLEIQAARAAKPGIAYPADDRMQHEFEASFLFEDTPDQVDAMGSIKDDMQLARPMDRLLCGDVGYGKTELAVRAAFKAVLAGRQVAVLVPTTVLAQQHFQTFTDRFVEYPIVVEVLSRFKTKKQQTSIVERTATGAVDILIGTHRLLSQDVSFADLGLVIVDEEQRFGVEHKTRLRQVRKTVDVLTMTATPIPRTLHMAMLGIRDISTLSTPPPGRQSIRTEVVEFDANRIRSGILREMNRGGQIFFVHNRVQTIDAMQRKLRGIVPEARFAIVHGQMREHELEKGMLAFIRGEVDVLVTTTIIESGLDIPNANTMYLDRADRFGLAEMHQLRGRVGRYRHRAYCYLIVPKRRVSNVAEKRIRAVEEFQELGAGFRIAMRDLEIRGAGNILGSQQSGHIAAVGYELFCQLLEDAVHELKEREPVERTDPFIELDIGARLDDEYVPDAKLKIEVYRRLARAKTEEELPGIVEGIEDRFGPMPREAALLVEIARLRILAAALRIEHVVRPEPDRVALRPADMTILTSGLGHVADRVRVVTEKTVHLLLEDRGSEGEDLLTDLQNAFRC
ncbi:MAG: transcription-repair coupling factor [Planctomycetota bacterium]